MLEHVAGKVSSMKQNTVSYSKSYNISEMRLSKVYYKPDRHIVFCKLPYTLTFVVFIIPVNAQ